MLRKQKQIKLARSKNAVLKLIFFLGLFYSFIIVSANAQMLHVTGVVYDENDDPLIGATPDLSL